MIKDDFLVNISSFKKISALKYTDNTQIFLVQEEQSKELYIAKSFNIQTDDLYKIMPISKLLVMSLICNAFPSLFIKFEGFSELNFDTKSQPVIFTKYEEKSSLSQIIQNEKNGTISAEWNDTKKLINIYGISMALAYLSKYNILNINLDINNVYETENFYPKIDIYNFEMQNKENSRISLHSFAKIIYTIITGEDLNESNDKLLDDMNKKMPEQYKKLILNCFSSDCSVLYTFERIVFELEMDEVFLTNKINKKEYYDYIKFVNKHTIDKYKNDEFGHDYNEENEILESLYSSNVPVIDLKQFEKIERIGLKKIYKIKNKKTGKIYIEKVCMDDSKITKKYFLREILINSQIKHPLFTNFIGYSPVNFKNKLEFVLIVDYMSNDSLSNLLELEKRGNEISFWNDTMKLINIYSIAKAMEYLHSKDILHRDLKPQNILFDEYLFPHICDFGLSQLSTKTNLTIAGTFLYMAPEIIESSKHSKASDVYSFAFIVYDIIVNKKINIKTSIFQYQTSVIKDNHRPEISKEIPEAYKNLIEICWDRNQDKRPSFETIVNELKNNKKFITNKIDEHTYRAYIEYIDNALLKPERKDDEKLKRIFEKHSLQPIYEDYRKIMELNDPLSKQVQTIDLKEFEKIKKIDNGGFGEVFIIKDIKTGIKYAAKKLNIISKNISDFKERIRFSREVTILSKIYHPSIIKYIGYSPTDMKNKPHPIIVTELMPNGSLESLLEYEREGIEIPFWTDTMKLIQIYGIASAMEYLHSKEILHRDLKPDNILLEDHLFPILCDFGLAKYLTENEINKTQAEINSEIIGTFQYMAPEIHINQIFNKSTDVYSFGMTLYEILSKKEPFAGLSKEQILYQIIFQTKRPKLEKSIPDAYQKLINLCWNQDPNKRHTFSYIVNEIKNNPNYITNNVDKKLFESYVDFIDNQNDNYKKLFSTFSIDTIKKEFIFEKSFASCEGFLDIDFYEEEDEIESNTLYSIFGVTEKRTGEKYSATISNYVEKFTREELRQISEETKNLSKIKNPTIQQFIGFSFVDFEHQRKPVTINEKCNGITLLDFLVKKQNELSMTKKLIIIYGIAYAMSLLHSHHIQHPNVNLSNVIIDEKYQPKLSEIGFYINPQNSKSAKSIPSKINFLSFYSAPEILENQIHSNKSDVYSYAFIVYSIMTNIIPFHDIKDYQQLFRKIVNDFYRPPIKEIPKIYCHLIEKCWSQNPNDRPSFDEIIHQLENDPNFLNNGVSNEEYYNYIKYIKTIKV